MIIMPKALDVSRLLLAWACENGDLITNLKLQKLLYYAQAWHLVNYKKPLFSDNIEAWEFGPVIPSIYTHWKNYKSSPIPYKPNREEDKPFTEEQRSYLHEFARVFMNFSATALVSMTHNEAPWQQAFEKSDKVISQDNMLKFYTQLYHQKYGKTKKTKTKVCR